MTGAPIGFHLTNRTHCEIFVKYIPDGGGCAVRWDIFAIWKTVPISNINHYQKTHLEYFKFYFYLNVCHNLGKFVWTNKNDLGLCPKTNVDLNHWLFF